MRFCSLTIAILLSFGVTASQNYVSAQSGSSSKGNSKYDIKEDLNVPYRKVEIAKVDPDKLSQAKASAAKIDRMVEANYRKHGVRPNGLTSDGEFVRRIYLDIAGTIPSYKKARTFVRSRSPNKRERVIDELLNDEGYAIHMYNYWADILRITPSRLQSNFVTGVAYEEWVKTVFEENMPYDEFVYRLLAAEGRIWDDPASGYYQRDAGMNLDVINNTVRIFMGTRIGCAQCHDHPFDRWRQKEFYEMAAFVNNVGTRKSSRNAFGKKDVMRHFKEELMEADPDFIGNTKYHRWTLAQLYDVHDTNRKTTLPHDYAYDDAKPKSVVTPKTIFDPQPEIQPGETSREAFARWMTAPENPRFTKTIVNRLWKRAFGVGLIEPEDDMKDDSVVENPELMDYLISEMIRLNYDLKEFQRIIYHTKTYQQKSSGSEVKPGEVYHFPGPILRRMSPEQVWDSFITLAVTDP